MASHQPQKVTWHIADESDAALREAIDAHLRYLVVPSSTALWHQYVATVEHFGPVNNRRFSKWIRWRASLRDRREKDFDRTFEQNVGVWKSIKQRRWAEEDAIKTLAPDETTEDATDATSTDMDDVAEAGSAAEGRVAVIEGNCYSLDVGDESQPHRHLGQTGSRTVTSKRCHCHQPKAFPPSPGLFLEPRLRHPSSSPAPVIYQQ